MHNSRETYWHIGIQSSQHRIYCCIRSTMLLHKTHHETCNEMCGVWISALNGICLILALKYESWIWASSASRCCSLAIKCNFCLLRPWQVRFVVISIVYFLGMYSGHSEVIYSLGTSREWNFGFRATHLCNVIRLMLVAFMFLVIRPWPTRALIGPFTWGLWIYDLSNFI